MARPASIATKCAAPNAALTGCPKTDNPKAARFVARNAAPGGDCGRRYIPEAAYHLPSAANKERAMAMYREGSSLRAIGRVFGVSAQAVSVWVKKGGAPRGPGCGAGANSATPVLAAFRRRR